MPCYAKLIFVTMGIIVGLMILGAARSSYWASMHGWTMLYGDKAMTREFYQQCLLDGNDPVITQSAKHVYKAVCRTNKD
jgi:hypothetical protein